MQIQTKIQMKMQIQIHIQIQMKLQNIPTIQFFTWTNTCLFLTGRFKYEVSMISNNKMPIQMQIQMQIQAQL